MKLYQINEMIEEIFDNCEITEDGEFLISDKMLAYLDELEEMKDSKIESLIKYYKDIIGDIAKFKAEIDDLSKSKKHLENKAESIKKFLDFQHQGNAKTYGVHKISYRKSTVLIGNNVDVLPVDLTTIEVTPLKSEIKKKLQEGSEFEGWELKTNKNIQIK